MLKTFPDECVDCIVTSPPYYGLRDYGVSDQIGLEPSFGEYLERMLAVTAELKRVLKSTGTMWWNHGDSYNGSGKAGGNKHYLKKHTQFGKLEKEERCGRPTFLKEMPTKSLMLQNFRLAQRMIDEQGWYLRNVLIWWKPNCMPSSVRDRFTVDYEPLFFFTKSKKYWFEPQYEAFESNVYDRARMAKARTEYGGKWAQESGGAIKTQRAFVAGHALGRNKRCVWRIPTRPFPGAHFAVFPEALVETPIKAGCPWMICRKCGKAREPIIKSQFRQHSIGATSGRYYKERNFKGDNTVLNSSVTVGYTDCGCKAGWEPGIVLDPFMGSGTTAFVAQRLGRRWMGIELNPKYIKIAERRLGQARVVKNLNQEGNEMIAACGA
ncbi:MAG TPA: site-specific DNA-methyltransferase [candidate division Zixibacteria bacterium]|nr:site-specific DNA-methyltransferase [candidate division Zixibacteria bacterium]